MLELVCREVTQNERVVKARESFEELESYVSKVDESAM